MIYIKTFIGLAGIEITVFTAHSARSSATSKANNVGLGIKVIERAAGWSSSSTFTKHHKLPIKKNFGSVVLKGRSRQL